MKKLVVFGVLLGLMVSCGPRRLGCGPGRCAVDKTQKTVAKPC